MTDDIRVLIGDDDSSTRAGVRHALEGHGFSICAEEATAEAAVEAALRERPDLCILDVRLPGNGIRAARRIGEDSPNQPAVMLTVSDDDEDLFDALLAGASGYLPKGWCPTVSPMPSGESWPARPRSPAPSSPGCWRSSALARVAGAGSC